MNTQCAYCGEFFHIVIEICPFCSSEGLIPMIPEDEIEWGRKPAQVEV